MKSGDIFQYTDPTEILKHLFEDKQKRNPLFSLRSWARKLGFRSPSYLSEVLNGKRALKPELALRVSDSVNLPPREKAYFETLTYLANAKTDSDRDYFQSILDHLLPEKKIELMYGNYIEDWRHFVIDETPCLHDFRNDPKYLAKRMGKDFTPAVVKKGLQTLIKGGFLRENSNGDIERPVYHIIKDPKEDNESHKRFLKDMFEQTSRRIISQHSSEKFCKVGTVPIRTQDVEKCQDLIEKCWSNLVDLEAKSGADHVYMFSFGFARVTENLKEEEKQ